MLVVMIVCSAETPSYHRPASNKHLPLACVQAQTDIKTLIAGTLINRNKAREICRALAEILKIFSHGSTVCGGGGEKLEAEALRSVMTAAEGFLFAERVKLALCHRRRTTDDGLSHLAS